MVLATGLGFTGVGWPAILIIALFLTLLSSGKHGALARRYADVDEARVLALSIGTTAANNLAFTAMTFAAGRAFAWLVST